MRVAGDFSGEEGEQRGIEARSSESSRAVVPLICLTDKKLIVLLQRESWSELSGGWRRAFVGKLKGCSTICLLN